MTEHKKLFYPYNEEEILHYRSKLTPEQRQRISMQLMRVIEKMKKAKIIYPDKDKSAKK